MIATKQTATDGEIAAVEVENRKTQRLPKRSHGTHEAQPGAVEKETPTEDAARPRQPDIERAEPNDDLYKLASANARPGQRTVLEIAGRKIGGEHFALIAGPCTVESSEQTLRTAHAVADAGASMFRGGAYKPRTSPYAFQGLGREGLRILAQAKAQTGLPIVTELMDMRDIDAVLEVADVVQIGARNMQNYPLLSEVGRSGRTVLLKRGLSSTLQELLLAAEYILREGNPNVILCERGIRTFETAYRFTLDLMAVPVLKELSHLPVVVDPSHAAGRRDLVGPLSLAAAAVGADGIIVEVHPDPDQAICDGPQSLPTDSFAAYAASVGSAAELAGKSFSVL
jgi:3-deoxy-7-phosphoheptulonate synthase